MRRIWSRSTIDFFYTNQGYLFSTAVIERGREREKHRCERKVLTHHLLFMPRLGIRSVQTGGCATGLGTHPRPGHVTWLGISSQPFSQRTTLPPTEPHLPGQGVQIFNCERWLSPRYHMNKNVNTSVSKSKFIVVIQISNTITNQSK